MGLRAAIVKKFPGLGGFLDMHQPAEGAFAVFGDNPCGGLGRCQVIGTTVTLSMDDALAQVADAKAKRLTYPPSIGICKRVDGKWRAL